MDRLLCGCWVWKTEVAIRLFSRVMDGVAAFFIPINNISTTAL